MALLPLGLAEMPLPVNPTPDTSPRYWSPYGHTIFIFGASAAFDGRSCHPLQNGLHVSVMSRIHAHDPSPSFIIGLKASTFHPRSSLAYHPPPAYLILTNTLGLQWVNHLQSFHIISTFLVVMALGHRSEEESTCVVGSIVTDPL